MSESLDDVIKSLEQIQGEKELTIIKLSEPFSELLTKRLSKERTSDIQSEEFDNPTPATLETDLIHYKELFAKLRFSYLEQVTKEKFIRAIVGDPPLVVEHQENVELEESLAQKKLALKSLKTEVADLVVELEKKGRELYQKYHHIQLQTTELQALPSKLKSLEESIKSLKNLQNVETNPNLLLPLDKTLELIELREKETAELDRQINHLQEAILPRKTNELETLNTELHSLEAKSLSSTLSAEEAKKRKENSINVENDLEERARWWTGVEDMLKGIFSMEPM
ncbi:putative 60s ribosomal protein l37 protein [Erysiphe necator]|uniref:Putative 60s ribosomal protein l37 protein n=1 Tax=Uncinula necator TaxID=52586 RepID=A0A0B1P357_UNCNE|nr:putative 60s ribosomal protein l37 protein [Erysiphe necator]